MVSLGVCCSEGDGSRAHIEHSAPKTPDITRGGMLTTLNDFRGDERWGTAESLGDRMRDFREVVSGSEIGQLGDSLSSNEHVSGFQIPVNNIVLVQMKISEEKQIELSHVELNLENIPRNSNCDRTTRDSIRSDFILRSLG